MGTDKMSGEVSRSRQKKAAAPPAKKAQNGTNGGSTTSKSSNWNKENKKKSKDRKNKQNMASPKKSSQSGFLCSTWTLVILLTLTGISVASYHQYPEKVQAVLDVLPPQVQEGLVQARQITSQTWDVVSTKSSKIGLAKAKEGYIQVADVIVEQYHIYLPTINIYWNQVKSGAQSIGSQALDHGTKVTSGVQEIVIDTYDKISPQAIVYFDTVKDTTVHYGKIVSAKSADFILDGIDMASDGYGMVHPYIQKAVDGTKDTLGPYIGPYVGPYWDAFYNHVAEMYKESNALARQWTREINIGEINLEQFLFKEEIEKERLEKAKLAAEKNRGCS